MNKNLYSDIKSIRELENDVLSIMGSIKDTGKSSLIAETKLRLLKDWGRDKTAMIEVINLRISEAKAWNNPQFCEAKTYTVSFLKELRDVLQGAKI